MKGLHTAESAGVVPSLLTVLRYIKGDEQQMQTDNAISGLNNLIETCKDGELGFKTAAGGLSPTSS